MILRWKTELIEVNWIERTKKFEKVRESSVSNLKRPVRWHCISSFIWGLTYTSNVHQNAVCFKAEQVCSTGWLRYFHRILITALIHVVLLVLPGSKRGNNAALSGVTSNAKGGQIQVFHNGKIVTPQSLLPRGAGPATIPDKGGSNTSVSNNDNNNISNNVSNNVSNNQAEDPKEARPRAPMLTHERKASVKK